ncbi:MAG TPA: hypothetical protein VIN59_08100 [Alphaproteobacteria bacterium]
MNKTLKTLLAGLLTLAVLAPAAFAEEFVVDQDKYDRHQAMQDLKRTHIEPVRGYQKGKFSGSSAYTGGLTGRVAVQTDRIGDMDGRAFTIRPIRGTTQEFNANLRYGDTNQSYESRFNHTFNN